MAPTEHLDVLVVGAGLSGICAGHYPQNLRSGYIQRAQRKIPQQGSRHPWRMYQSCLQDYRATRRADVDDGDMRFNNPVTPVAREPEVAAR